MPCASRRAASWECRSRVNSALFLVAQSDNGRVASETHYSGAVTTDRYGQLAEANGDLRATFSLLRTARWRTGEPNRWRFPARAQ
jgi:hypothetical protein